MRKVARKAIEARRSARKRTKVLNTWKRKLNFKLKKLSLVLVATRSRWLCTFFQIEQSPSRHGKLADEGSVARAETRLTLHRRKVSKVFKLTSFRSRGTERCECNLSRTFSARFATKRS